MVSYESISSDMNYHLTLEQFEGPFEKLLELIENEKLDITRVSLARVTDEFIAYIQTLEDNHESHSLVADFLLVASKLVLIKSKVLLPALELDEEEEVDITNLETRLKLYSELKGTKTALKNLWHENPVIFDREYLILEEPVFRAPPGLETATLVDRIRKIVGELERIFHHKVVVKEEVVRLKERIEHILDRITKSPLRLSAMQKTATKSELVVFFLALLHIVKDQLAQVEQEGAFGDICITGHINHKPIPQEI